MYTFLRVNNKGADQTAWMRRQVCTCIVLTQQCQAFHDEARNTCRYLKNWQTNCQCDCKSCPGIFFISGGKETKNLGCFELKSTYFHSDFIKSDKEVRCYQWSVQ